MKNPPCVRGWDDTVNIGVGEGWGITPRPRALHNMDLRPGDVVRLEGWQDGSRNSIDRCYTVNDDVSRALCGAGDWVSILSPSPKGHRPLFTIVSRAPVAPVPDNALFEAGVLAGLEAAAIRIVSFPGGR